MLKRDYDGGMGIKLEGLHALQELEMMIHEAFAKFRDSGVHNASPRISTSTCAMPTALPCASGNIPGTSW